MRVIYYVGDYDLYDIGCDHDVYYNYCYASDNNVVAGDVEYHLARRQVNDDST